MNKIQAPILKSDSDINVYFSKRIQNKHQEKGKNYRHCTFLI